MVDGCERVVVVSVMVCYCVALRKAGEVLDAKVKNDGRWKVALQVRLRVVWVVDGRR